MSLTIQERIKDLRVERKLTLKELAEQTGLSPSALGSYHAVLQADKAPLQQIDRGRKTVAGTNCPEVGTAKKLCSAEGEETEIGIFAPQI